MWPGQQPPGGEQNPHNPNPYQQAGHQQQGPQQPNPYQQQGYQQQGYQQPNPYQQQPGFPPQQPQGHAPQWNVPGAPGAPQPPRDNRKKVTVIAVVAAVAVVIAATVTGVILLGGDEKNDDKKAVATDDKGSAAPSAPAPPAPSGAAQDNPRGAPAAEVKPVVQGWQAVTNQKRGVAFDVPPEWKVLGSGYSWSIADENKKDDKALFPTPLLTMSGPAVYKEKYCSVPESKGSYSVATVGAKGAQGAKGTAEAAKIESGNWAFGAFDQQKSGKFDVGESKPFTTTHGISGHVSMTTVTGVKKRNKCETDGKAYAVSYKAPSGDLATWILTSVKGTPEEVPDETIQKIMSTLRPLAS
ncbi:hypothetical protein [Streptomyces sp. URMC 123]|uniref:hypothetical protein n=1 Tax=Streptomyces sp. URMC 123 TaxID=3423403 RepID=UPI003F1D4588